MTRHLQKCPTQKNKNYIFTCFEIWNNRIFIVFILLEIDDVLGFSKKKFSLKSGEKLKNTSNQ